MLNSHQRSPAVLGCGIQRYNISVNVLGISELADAYPTRPFDNMQTGSLIALFGIMEGNEDHIRKKHEFSLNFQNLSCPSELRFQTVCRGSESKKASGSFNDEFVTVHGVCSVAQIMVGHVDFFLFLLLRTGKVINFWFCSRQEQGLCLVSELCAEDPQN